MGLVLNNTNKSLKSAFICALLCFLNFKFTIYNLQFTILNQEVSYFSVLFVVLCENKGVDFLPVLVIVSAQTKRDIFMLGVESGIIS